MLEQVVLCLLAGLLLGLVLAAGITLADRMSRTGPRRRWGHPWHGTPAHPDCARCQAVAARHGVRITRSGLLSAAARSDG